MYVERASRVPRATVWTRTTVPGEARVLPDGCLDLIWRDGELLVAGPDTAAHVVRSPGGVRYAALRFAPGTGDLVLGVPADALRDARTPLRAIWPDRVARRLAERIADAEDPAVALEAALVRRLADVPPPPPWRAAAVAAARAGTPVAQTAAALGWSERQLHRRSLAAFGYGPKTLARVLRLVAAVEAADRGLPLVEIAATAGYADQPHLSRDVRALAGTTPRDLLGARSVGPAAGPGT